MKIKNLFIIFFILSYGGMFSQNELDSLRKRYAATRSDTGLIPYYTEMSNFHKFYKAFDSSEIYVLKALKLISKTGKTRFKGRCLKIYAILRYEIHNEQFSDSLFKEAIKLINKDSAPNDYFICWNYLGAIYYANGDRNNALNAFYNALSVAEKKGWDLKSAKIYTDIGNLYYETKKYDKALRMHLKAKILADKLNDASTKFASYNNIGNVYSDLAKEKKVSKYRDSALFYFNGIVKLSGESGDSSAYSTALGNIGVVYLDDEKFETALNYFKNCIHIKELIYDTASAIVFYNNAGIALFQSKKYDEALQYFTKAVRSAERIDYKEDLLSGYDFLAKINYIKGNYKKAYDYYVKFKDINDTLFNSDNSEKQKESEMNYEFEKKAAIARIEQERKDAQIKEEKRIDGIIRYSILSGLFMVLILAFVIFRSLLQNKKKNKIITEQKGLVEQQKELVEEKQKEIIDSITYAKRIQGAILPPPQEIKKHLPESFILYKPKDIVAGDFYWFHKHGDDILIAAADCTGHGVPGALVSVVCSNALNRSAQEFDIHDPGKLLDKTTELVLDTFAKSGEEIKDGMDISLIKINLKTKKAEWSGANNPLWYFEKNEFKELKADKQPIGKSDNRKPFLTHQIQLKENDMVYLLTDGYADQFGGPKGKKFKYKQLEELLMKYHSESADIQMEILNETFNNWKSDLEQVDDVTIIGFKL